MGREEVKQKAHRMRIKRHPPNLKTIWLKTMIFVSLFVNAGESKAFAFDRDDKTTTETTPDFKTNYATDEDIEKYISVNGVKEKLITDITRKKTLELQNEIIENISQLQSNVRNEKRHGRRYTFISKLLRKVSPFSNGKSNYCVAGAMSAYCSIGDSTIKPFIDNMIASKDVLPKDLNLCSHPNISCPAFRAYYKQTLGSNFIDKKSPDFNNQFKHLEKGDVILVFSSQNTSSGFHCVIFEKYDNGQICVKSLNNENDYSIKPGRISCVAKFPNQFRQNLSQALENNDELLISFIRSDASLYNRVTSQIVKIPPRTARFVGVVEAKDNFKVL